MLLIPDLSRTPFSALSVHFFLNDLCAPCDSEVLQRAFIGKDFKLTGSDSTTFSKPYLLSMGIESSKYDKSGKADAVIDISVCLDRLALLSNELSPGGEQGEGWASPITVHEFRAYLTDHLGVLDGLPLIVEATCAFEINVNQLPPGGIVRRGLAARAQFGDDTLYLSGAQFAINGGTEHRISWFMDTWELVEGSIFSLDAKVFGRKLLPDLLEIAQQRFLRYILESNGAETK